MSNEDMQLIMDIFISIGEITTGSIHLILIQREFLQRNKSKLMVSQQRYTLMEI